MRTHKLSLAVSAALALTAIPFQSALAQGERAGGLEEVVVTARKREESLQDAPLTVSAFDSKRINE